MGFNQISGFNTHNFCSIDVVGDDGHDDDEDFVGSDLFHHRRNLGPGEARLPARK